MSNAIIDKMRVAFQGEPGAFSEEAAVQLLGGSITTVPRPTFDLSFRSIDDGLADAILVPVENTLAGPVVRVYDLLLESPLGIVAETILPIEHNVIGCPGATIEGLRSVASHPMALAQCERFFSTYPHLKRVPAEDTAGSVREALASGDKSRAGIAGPRAAQHYGGIILIPAIQDNAENFTRFVLLIPVEREHDPELDLPNSSRVMSPGATDIMVALRMREMDASDREWTLKMSVAMRLAHCPGALLAALEPFARHGVNLLKIESRPIHGRPWEYQFFLDLETPSTSAGAETLEAAFSEVGKATSQLRILGFYRARSSAPIQK
ncbi:MAG: prephenate dehydratase domain-containing protein [Candidatus Acidiferrum sp.]